MAIHRKIGKSEHLTKDIQMSSNYNKKYTASLSEKCKLNSEWDTTTHPLEGNKNSDHTKCLLRTQNNWDPHTLLVEL